MATKGRRASPIVDPIVGPAASRRLRRRGDNDRAPVTLLVADLYAPARAGVRTAVEPYGFKVVAEAADTVSAIAAAMRKRPRLCVIAADLPGDGLEATRAITEKLP